jgi:fluoride exporter
MWRLPSCAACGWLVERVGVGGGFDDRWCRFDVAVPRRSARSFPFGTLAVNLSGAAVLGVIAGLALEGDAALLAGTAAVGSYTTFSTWMLETRLLTAERQLGIATANIVFSVTLGVAAAFVGQTIVLNL